MSNPRERSLPTCRHCEAPVLVMRGAYADPDDPIGTHEFTKRASTDPRTRDLAMGPRAVTA
ncbi:MAG: hypothetical protein E6R04_08055 [Spirochaetes bacterium]|nr:MAG: hypothetical protein E6R04_08055 [Spirochaetota bacterium]